MPLICCPRDPLNDSAGMPNMKPIPKMQSMQRRTRGDTENETGDASGVTDNQVWNEGGIV